jgi:Ca-activated chloride channel family protein
VSFVLDLERPDLLVLGPLTALLLAFSLGSQWQRLNRLMEGYSSVALGRLLPPRLGRFPSVRLVCLVVGGLAIGLGAAGPAWMVPEPEALPPLDVAIAVDISPSMSATDATPTRIERARVVVERLSQDLPSVRFSLVAASGWSYALLPPTDDPALARYFAQSLDVGLVPPADRGTALAYGLEQAAYAIEARPSPQGRRLVLLISDGETHAADTVVAASAALRETGLEVWVAALGSDGDTPLFLDGVPLTDEGGAPVVSSLNESLLREVADAGGGRYVDVTTDDGLESLVAGLRELSGDRDDPPPPPIDAAFLLVLLAIPLFLWEAVLDLGRSREGTS